MKLCPVTDYCCPDFLWGGRCKMESPEKFCYAYKEGDNDDEERYAPTESEGETETAQGNP